MAFETATKRTNQYLIARRKMTFSVVAGTSETEDVEINGELLNYVAVAPDLTTDTTFDFTISNEDSVPVYSNTGISDNATTPVLVSGAPIPMSGTMTFKVSFATSQTAEIVVYMYYK